jgi:hypothetical protein
VRATTGMTTTGMTSTGTTINTTIVTRAPSPATSTI